MVDASVVVEYLLKTDLGNAITDFLESRSLAAPELMDIEVLSALRREVLKHELSESRASSAVDLLSSWNIRRVPHRELLRATWHHFRNVSSYDSAYLATAEKLDVDLLTADSKLTRAPRLNVVVHDVRDANVLARIQSW